MLVKIGGGDFVYLNCIYTNHNNNPHKPRTPQSQPIVFRNGHRFYFESTNNPFTLIITKEQQVLYQTIINVKTNFIDIPSNINGPIELTLIFSDAKYAGNINL